MFINTNFFYTLTLRFFLYDYLFAARIKHDNMQKF